MDDESRKRAVGAFDIFVSLFILLVGCIVILFGLSWSGYVESLSTGNREMLSWLEWTPWIIILTGLTTVIYAVKRMLDDVLKAI